jgi:hypothetical protein
MAAKVNRVTGRQYLIGCPAYCGEAPCGHLAVLVVERATGRLAHLIILPEHSTDSRLVPAAMARPEGETVRLDCTLDEFLGLESAVEIPPMPLDPDEPVRRRHDEIPTSPYFGLGPGGPNPGLAAPEPVLTPRLDYEDHVPPSEVRVYPGDHAHATDGPVGHVRGVVTGPDDDMVTHILLDEGHMWARKRVAIPMRLVGAVDDEGVRVRLTKQEIKELPEAEVAAAAERV